MDRFAEEHVVRLERALFSLDRQGVRSVLEQAVSAGGLPALEAVMVPALERIGDGWEQGRVSLSQVYMSGRLCEELMEAFLPPSGDGASNPPVAIVVLEDYHMLGKRLVVSVLRAGGVSLHDYGRLDMSGIVSRAKADGIRILLVSVLMLRAALRVKELRAGLQDAGCRIALVAGGAPFRLDPQLWREVGADATADTAAGCISVVRRLLDGLQ